MNAPSKDPQIESLKVPPHSIEAEQSVLGGMLLSKDAIADVLEILRPGDFYRPAHQAVFEAILTLYSKGEPADAVTVEGGTAGEQIDIASGGGETTLGCDATDGDVDVLAVAAGKPSYR